MSVESGYGCAESVSASANGDGGEVSLTVGENENGEEYDSESGGCDAEIDTSQQPTGYSRRGVI